MNKTPPWHKDGVCKDCGEKDCPFGDVLMWEDCLIEKMGDDADISIIGAVAMSRLYVIMYDLAVK